MNNDDGSQWSAPHHCRIVVLRIVLFVVWVRFGGHHIWGTLIFILNHSQTHYINDLIDDGIETLGLLLFVQECTQ